MENITEIQIASLKDNAITFYKEALGKTETALTNATFFRNGISKIEIRAGYSGFEFSFVISGPECCPKESSTEQE